MHGPRSKMFVLSSGFAVALAAAACGGADTNNNADNARAANGSAAAGAKQNAAMTVTGCLQKGSGLREYILTQATRGGNTVGTSGTSEANPAAGNGSAIEREQMHAAMKSYRLGGNTDQLSDLVGKQVRVSGSMADAGDLQKNDHANDQNDRANDRAAASKDNKDNSNRRDIDAADLAKIDVQSVDKVADNCSNPQAGSPTKSNR